MRIFSSVCFPLFICRTVGVIITHIRKSIRLETPRKHFPFYDERTWTQTRPNAPEKDRERLDGNTVELIAVADKKVSAYTSRQATIHTHIHARNNDCWTEAKAAINLVQKSWHSSRLAPVPLGSCKSGHKCAARNYKFPTQINNSV